MARDLSRWTYIGEGVWRQKARLELVEAEEVEADEEPMTPDETEEPMNAAEAEGNGEVEDNGYSHMTKPELEAELKSRGLPKYGNKPELIERLVADDGA